MLPPVISSLKTVSFYFALRQSVRQPHQQRMLTRKHSQTPAQHGKHIVGRRHGRRGDFRLRRLVRRDVILHVRACLEVLKGFLGDG